MTEYTRHPGSAALPDLSDEESESLRKSMLERGFDPAQPIIVTSAGEIVDGWHRYQMASEVGVLPFVEARDFTTADEMASFVVGNQLGRRSLKPAERASLTVAVLQAVGQAFAERGEGRGNQALTNDKNVSNDTFLGDGKITRKRVAELANVGEATAQRAIAAAKTRRHPAQYTEGVVEAAAEMLPLPGFRRVLDPFAGVGRRIQVLAERGYELTLVEIDPHWDDTHPGVEQGDATDLEFEDDMFDAIVTSPTYGNKLAYGHHPHHDSHTRDDYASRYKEGLSERNTGAFGWVGDQGDTYRDLHAQAWWQAARVLRPGGRLVLSCKDHVRSGVRQRVVAWHIDTLNAMGFRVVDLDAIPTSGFGRSPIEAELVICFELKR